MSERVNWQTDTRYWKKGAYAIPQWLRGVVPKADNSLQLRQRFLSEQFCRSKVCDPACGSGHFLIAAAHRLARHLARIRTGESEPGPNDYQHALRDVIGRCIYGVDINPMAVELCKVSLWMEAIEAGKPLSFLDQHILCGNSLLGTTPHFWPKAYQTMPLLPLKATRKKFAAS